MTRHDPQVALRHMRGFAMEAIEMSATADRAALDWPSSRGSLARLDEGGAQRSPSA
jgi:hypothetical protein